MSSKQKPEILRKRKLANVMNITSLPLQKLLSILKILKFFNGAKCLTDKCTSFAYNLVNVENDEDGKNESTNSNNNRKCKRTICLSYLLKLFKLWWCATNETSQKT